MSRTLEREALSRSEMAGWAATLEEVSTDISESLRNSK